MSVSNIQQLVTLVLVTSLFAKTTVQRLITTIENDISKLDDFYVDYLPPSCQIYCYGKILHTVQMANIYSDSKTFVDMKLKFSPAETSTNFTKFMASKNNEPTTEEIKDFVNLNFIERGTEFELWEPQDWSQSPLFLDEIYEAELKEWGKDLNLIWKELGRKMIDDVHKNPDYYSIIPVNNPVIVPGGRFVEFYYWDSYWIIRGLLYCGMKDTVRGMLLNFMSIVQRYGFIPNGGRVYYATRSQPPLLPAMIKSYLEFTNDTKFAIDSINILEHEFQYWMNNHIVQVRGHDVAIYGGVSNGPRPESYREDIETAKHLKTDEEKENLYAELRAAAESGMDFSSRWFINNEGSREGDLSSLKTRSIVPVELNAILYWNAKIIAEFYALANNVNKKLEYEEKANKIMQAINDVHWNEKAGAWLDYDMINKKPRDFFVPTNLSPLWMKAYDTANTNKISAAVLKYIKGLTLDKFPGGVPNTLYHSGEQWDYPNVWPPMQYILIEGLANLGTPAAKTLATSWSHRWVKSNYKAYSETKAMFEKYNAEIFGGHGGGGEYDVQKGFGWTNGIIIELLAKYGKDIRLSAKNSAGTILRATTFLHVTALSFLFIIVEALLTARIGINILN